MKKRVLSVLVAVMLVACMFTSAMAATAGLEAPTSVEVDEKIVATVTTPVLEDVSAATVEARVAFDKDNLTLVEYKVGTAASTVEDVVVVKNSSSVDEANAAGYFTFTLTTSNGENAIALDKVVEAVATFEVKEGATEVKQFELVRYYVEVIGADGIGEEIFGLADAAKPEGAVITINVPCEHDWVVAAEKVEPTCTANGAEVAYVCSKCGDTKGGEEIKALGHKWGEWKVNEDKTTETRACERCDATETREYNPETGDTMSAVLFLAMAAMFVAGIVVVNKARKHA